MGNAPLAVVFDLDGTLVDSRGDIVASVNHALLESGRTALAPASVVPLIGDGARALVARAARLSELDPETDALLERFVDYYVAHPLDFSRWMEGAPHVLDRVADLGLPICLCTNKARPVTDAVLAGLGIRTRFRAVYAGGDGPEKKPAAGPLLALAKKLDVDPASMVVVGDGTQDVEAARRAGARVIGLTNGYTSRDRMLEARPDVAVDSLLEVPEILRRWSDATTRVAAQR
jgi:phosphoglycolate phosphatase